MYGRFKEDGSINGFYDDKINFVIPEDAVVITEEQWQELLNNQDTRRFINGEVVEYTPPPPPPPVIEPPFSVTSAQAKMALYSAGLYQQVKDAVANHPDEPVRIWFDNAGIWERNNIFVQAIGGTLGLSSEQIDDLFIAASKF